MIEKLIRRKGIESNRKLTKVYDKMQILIEILEKKDIPSEVITFINERIKLMNSFSGSEKELTKTLKNTYSQILKVIKEKMKFVPKNHYLSLWMVFGMLAGVLFSSALSSFGFMGIGSSHGMGISFGMLIGIIVGTNLDNQAKKNGNQLEI
jgi:hypothetical protein